MAKKQQSSVAKTREIYVNYPNDSPLIIQATVEEGNRSAYFSFHLALHKGETLVNALRRVAVDIEERLR